MHADTFCCVSIVIAEPYNIYTPSVSTVFSLAAGNHYRFCCNTCSGLSAFVTVAVELYLFGRCYPDRLGPSAKFVENSTKLTCLKITDYRIRYSRVLWLLELQIGHGRKVSTQVRTVNSNSRTSNCQRSLFSKKNPIIRIFCLSGWLAVPLNPDKCSAVLATMVNASTYFKRLS